MAADKRFPTCVLFGGGGFIGSHFANHLLAEGRASKVILADFQPIKLSSWPKNLQEEYTKGNVEFVELDVRKPITHPGLPAHADLIVNLAAVHREPGHKANEYFDTNIPGAENVCNWAKQVGCNRLVFVSSISTYGTEKNSEAKDEHSVPEPTTPYGISKLAAEKINIAWNQTDPNRRLLIVRPGLVFGPGEEGNLTRMIKAVLNRYFFYTGNKKTRKAGGYVKELCNSITWMLDRQDEHNSKEVLFNFTMDPAPTMEEYAKAICNTANVKRFIPNVPYPVLLAGSYIIQGLSKVLGIKQPINPTRIRKLLRSNSIVPAVLKEAGYSYKYTLEEALQDWLKERPEDWK